MTKTFILLALAVGLGLGFFIGQVGVLLSPEIGSNEEIKQDPDLKAEVEEEKSELDATTPDIVKTEEYKKDTVIADDKGNLFENKLFSMRYPSNWRHTDSVGIAQYHKDDLVYPHGIYFVSADAVLNRVDSEFTVSNLTKGNVLSVYYSFTSTQDLGYYDLSVLRSQDLKYTNQYRYEVIVVDGHNMIITNDPGFDDGTSYSHSLTAYTVDDEFEYSFVFDTPNNKDPREWELFKSILQTVRFK